jgi:hypothetical protein
MADSVEPEVVEADLVEAAAGVEIVVLAVALVRKKKLQRLW